MPVGDDAEFLGPKAFAKHLRNSPTPAERALWDELKGTKTGYKFRRQFQFDENTYVDLACTSAKVLIELDGASHEGKEDSDKARDERLRAAGFLVLRFSNDEVLHQPRKVADEIVKVCDGRSRRRY